MKPSDLSEFFNLLGKAKKEKEEEFDNLLKEADINLDDLTSSLVSGIKEAKEDQKKQKKNEEKLIEQLDSIIDVIENPKEVKDITEPAVTVGVPEDFDVTTLEDADDNETVEIIDIIKPEPIKTPEISDTVAQAIKFIEETNIKEEIENSDDTNLDKLKTEIKQVRDILYKVLAHGPGSGEVNLLKLDDVDEDSAKVDGKFLKYDASSGKFVGADASGGGGGSGITTANVRTGILDVAGIATFRSDTLVGSGISLSPDGDVFTTGVTTATSFVGDLTGDVTGTASNATQLNSQAASYYLNYNNFSNTPTIPSNNNQLTNGANFITASDNITGTSAGLTGTPSITINGLNAATGTFSGNVTVGGVLTYEDVTNVDSVGIITARSGVLVGSGITLSPDGDIFAVGVSTFSNDITFTGANHNIVFDKSDDRLELADGAEISFGDSEDFKIHYEYNRTLARQHGSGPFVFDLFNQFNFIHITGGQLAEDIAKFIPNGPIELYHDNTKRLSTSGIGATVFGQLDTTSNVAVGSGVTLSPDGDVFATGVTTSTTFVGDLTGDLTGDVTGSISGGTVAGSTGTFTTGVTTSLRSNKISVGDNEFINVGLGSDVQLYWTGSAGFLTNQGGGNLHFNSDTVLIKNAANSKSYIRAYNNSSVEIFHNNNKKFETAKTGAVVTGILTATSSVNVGSGITLSSDGDGFFTGVTTSITSSVIGSNTSPLTIGAVSSHHLTVANDNASMILGKSNSDALYLRREYATGRYTFQTFNGGNDGSIALQPYGGKVGIASAIPTSTLDVNGDVRVGSGITLSPDGDVFTTGISTFSDNVRIIDNKSLLIGDHASGDLSFVHDGNNSVIRNRTGDLYVSNASQTYFQLVGSTGAVKANHGGNLKFETTSSGVTVTGTLTASDGIKLTNADNLSILLGASEDMRIRHTGSHSEITDEGTGHLRLGGGQVRIGDATFSKNAAIFDASANTRLYFDDTLRFETASTGAVVTGILTATSFVGDGANLTNINADRIASGTVPDDRFPSTLPAVSGTNLTNINADRLASGTIPDARFPSVLPAIDGSNLTNISASGDITAVVAGTGLSGGATSGSATLNLAVALGEQVAVFRHAEAHDTDGGTFTSGSDQTRILNTEEHNDISGCSLNTSTGEFTLAAGTYLIYFQALAFDVSNHRAKIVTDGGTDKILGDNARSHTGDSTSTYSTGYGVVTNASSEGYFLKHRCTTTRSTTGFGRFCDFASEVENYATVVIFKMA